jgi:hypothetical protein
LQVARDLDRAELDWGLDGVTIGGHVDSSCRTGAGARWSPGYTIWPILLEGSHLDAARHKTRRQATYP